jgi:hypothetical protein
LKNCGRHSAPHHHRTPRDALLLRRILPAKTRFRAASVSFFSGFYVFAAVGRFLANRTRSWRFFLLDCTFVACRGVWDISLRFRLCGHPAKQFCGYGSPSRNRFGGIALPAGFFLPVLRMLFRLAVRVCAIFRRRCVRAR